MHGFLYIWHGLEFYWFDILYCKFNCLKTIISDTKLIQLTILHEIFSWFTLYTVLINIGTGRSEETVQILIRLLLRGQSDQGLHCFPLHLGPSEASLHYSDRKVQLLGQL